MFEMRWLGLRFGVVKRHSMYRKRKRERESYLTSEGALVPMAPWKSQYDLTKSVWVNLRDGSDRQN